MDFGAWGAGLTFCGIAAGLAFGWFIPSPKERALERESDQRERADSHSKRIEALEAGHRNLEFRVIEANAKFTARLDVLSGLCADLSLAIKDMTRAQRGRE